jgi:hypothetical protein
MTRTREQAMKAEQAGRIARNEQNNAMLDLIEFLDMADTEESETIDQLERSGWLQT